MPNNRMEHAHSVRSTRKGDAPLLAAHAGRWAYYSSDGTIERSVRLALVARANLRQTPQEAHDDRIQRKPHDSPRRAGTPQNKTVGTVGDGDVLLRLWGCVWVLEARDNTGTARRESGASGPDGGMDPIGDGDVDGDSEPHGLPLLGFEADNESVGERHLGVCVHGHHRNYGDWRVERMGQCGGVLCVSGRRRSGLDSPNYLVCLDVVEAGRDMRAVTDVADAS
jgi:hypothetical protein